MKVITTKSSSGDIKEFFSYGAIVFRNIFIMFAIFLIPMYLVVLFILVKNNEFLLAFFSTLGISNFILLFRGMIIDSKKLEWELKPNQFL